MSERQMGIDSAALLTVATARDAMQLEGGAHSMMKNSTFLRLACVPEQDATTRRLARSRSMVRRVRRLPVPPAAGPGETSRGHAGRPLRGMSEINQARHESFQFADYVCS